MVKQFFHRIGNQPLITILIAAVCLIIYVILIRSGFIEGAISGILYLFVVGVIFAVVSHLILRRNGPVG